VTPVRCVDRPLSARHRSVDCSRDCVRHASRVRVRVCGRVWSRGVTARAAPAREAGTLRALAPGGSVLPAVRSPPPAALGDAPLRSLSAVPLPVRGHSAVRRASAVALSRGGGSDHLNSRSRTSPLPARWPRHTAEDRLAQPKVSTSDPSAAQAEPEEPTSPSRSQSPNCTRAEDIFGSP